MPARPASWHLTALGPLVVISAGCFSAPAALPCGPELPCPVGLTCQGDRCQASDGPTAADAPPVVDACEPSCDEAAQALVGCGANVACPAACIDASPDVGAHCARIVPSNEASWPTVPLAPLEINDSVVLDTTTGAIHRLPDGDPIRGPGEGLVDGLEFLPAASTGMATFRVGSLAIAAGGTLWLTGDSPLILVVDGDAVVAGVIELGAGCAGSGNEVDASCPGPGGGEGGGRTLRISPAGGCGPGTNGVGGASDSESGGGGGGHGSRGGDGGATTTSGAAPAGGACGTAALEPLSGGSGGGAGGIDGTLRYGGRGGGGGGALQLSVAGTLEVSGTVDAAGGGGEAVPSTPGEDGGGGGGGSGGAILLEATRLIVSGVVVANGGGGGSGFTGTDGERGRRAGSQANGGPGTGTGTGGGRGGALAGTAQPGIDAGPNSDSGGGGGAIGRIVVRAPDGGATVDGVISPRPLESSAPVE